MLFVGVGIGNLTGSSLTIPANWDYYTVQAVNDSSTNISKVYEFHKQTDDCKGYETIRLCWLNKHGVWDYYNFTKKSTRSIQSTRTSYQQHEGTWNEETFKIKGYLGGKRQNTNNVKESIEINTDYITEEEGIWLEELLVSTDVFILEKSSTDNVTQGIIRKYVTPVIITNDSYTRQTKANDRLIQKTITIEKSINRRIQRR